MYTLYHSSFVYIVLSQLFSLHRLNLNQELPLLKIVHIFSGSRCVKSALYTVQSFQSFNGNYVYVKLYPVGHVCSVYPVYWIPMNSPCHIM